MGFQRVKFNNFRNLQPQQITLSGGLNMLTGFNASGKTNILEGINLLSGWGTLDNSAKLKELATRESAKEKVLLTGQLIGEYGEIVQVEIEKRISIRINDTTACATDLRIKNPVLTFLPNDTQLVEGSANRRRRMLDMFIALIVPSYAKRLNDYKVAIKQKSALLKQGRRTELIERVIIPLAVWIWKMRNEAVSLISEELSNLKELLPQETDICFSRGGANYAMDEKEDYIYAVKKSVEKERNFGVALVGPHRDDIILKCGQKEAATAISRGYRRRFAIALMLACADGVLRKTGKIPTLLLDEVTAELDSKGREIMFGTLLERRAQVIAATAEPVAEIYAFDGKKYSVDNGFVEEIKG